MLYLFKEPWVGDTVTPYRQDFRIYLFRSKSDVIELRITDWYVYVSADVREHSQEQQFNFCLIWFVVEAQWFTDISQLRTTCPRAIYVLREAELKVLYSECASNCPEP